jgi:D-psicose/D-tagatose/L-ribulose 3-epimerase
MNLLLWTASVGEDQFPLLARLKGFGYDGVELPLFEHEPDRFRRVAAELDNLGLERTAVTVMGAETNPIGPEPGVRQAAVDALKRAAESCQLLGVPMLVGPIHSALGQLAGRGRTDAEWAWGVETLRRAAEETEGSGVTFVVEFLNRFELYFLNTAADTRRFVDAVAHPRVRAMYDTFHANIEEQDIPAAIRVLGDRMVFVHISENHRGTPGTGLVQWDETFRAIRASGYDGWLTIEAFGRGLPELAAATCVWRDLFDSEENLARDGVRFVRQRWDRAGS